MSEAMDFYAIMISVLLGTAGLGGGLYETLLVDRVWPRTPMLIQPDRGGINRKLFWGPMHGLFELALIATIFLTWNDAGIAHWVWAAFAAHLIARVWSFAYFIPMAMRFEAGSAEGGAPAPDAARKWVRLSRWRLPMELLAVIFLLLALAKLAGETH